MAAVWGIVLLGVTFLMGQSVALAQTDNGRRDMSPQLSGASIVETPVEDPRMKLAEWQQLYEELKAREAALAAARRPAGPDLLAKLEAARAEAAPPAIRDLIERSLDWYAKRLPKSDLTQPLELPRDTVFLDVMMVRFKTQFTPKRPDGAVGIQRQSGDPALQVARLNSAEKSILWFPEVGFVLVSGVYFEPFTSGNLETQPAMVLGVGK